jgi:hypothetical protein
LSRRAAGHGEDIDPSVATPERRLGRNAAQPRQGLLDRALPTPVLVVGVCALGAAALAGYYAVRSVSWAVMTDELQIAKLATSIAERLSPVPYVHGVYYGALSQLYPLLIAPFYGALSPPAAERAAHVLNVVLLASTALPAYLLGRSVSGSRAGGYVSAALTVFTPWLVLATTILTENAAYPAFVWAVFLCHHALVKPGAWADAGALAGLLLAFFARTQLFVLALALPAALLLHELRLRHGPRRIVSSHPVLVAAYVAGAAVAGVLALTGSIGRVVGNYEVPFSGDLVPRGIWSSAAAHLVHVVVGGGVLPFLLALAWVPLALVVARRREEHAFAALVAVLVPLLTFEVASFDLRFTPYHFVQDRYLVYLVPLFAVCAAGFLAERSHPRLRALLVLGAAGVFAWLAGYAAYNDRALIFWASPAATFHPAVRTFAHWMHVSPDLALRLTPAAVAVLLALALWRAPRVALAGTAVVVSAFGAFEAFYVFDRFEDPTMTRASRSDVRDWIDRAVPNHRSVALVPSPHDNATQWWEVEFWNKDADRSLRVGAGRTFTPFPADDVSVDARHGLLRGASPSEYLVVSKQETRFHLQERAQVAASDGLRLIRVERPYRLAWAARHVTPDGWTRPRKMATFRVYSTGRRSRRTLELTLAASRYATKPILFTLRGPGGAVSGGVDPGGARPPVSLTFCVLKDGHADLTLFTNGQSPLPDRRVVALHLDAVAVRTARSSC